MVARWIPGEKQIKAGTAIRRESFKGEPGIRIPGVDTQKGIVMTGGAEAGYRKVLAQFYRDALERLPVFAALPEETALAAFAAQAHAIKSAAGTIGAAEVSAEAAVLEAAGKAGDMKTIRGTLPGFHERLTRLAGDIGNILETAREETDGNPPAGGGDREAVRAALSALREALKEKNMKRIDKVLEELEGLPLDEKDRDAVNAVSDKILMGEYRNAQEELDTILKDPA
jgi:HPt (histidine-containing phosphotransfer) domain-containing protein